MPVNNNQEVIEHYCHRNSGSIITTTSIIEDGKQRVSGTLSPALERYRPCRLRASMLEIRINATPHRVPLLIKTQLENLPNK